MLLDAIGLSGYEPWLAVALVAALLIAFASERYPPEVVAIGGMAAALVVGLVDVNGMMGALSNSAPWTIVAMFMLSGALARTGIIASLSARLERFARYGRTATIGALLVATMAMSAFVNNTPLVAVMIPLTVALAKAASLSPSRLLMPLSFAAILGGTLSLVGTSTNLLVDGIAREHGLAPFGIFEMTPIGLMVAAAGAVYLAIASRWLIPDRKTSAVGFGDRSRSQYLVEVLIPHDSHLIGTRPVDVALFTGPDRRILDVLRGDQSLRRTIDRIELAAGDVVVLRSPISDIISIRDDAGLEINAEESLEPVASRSTVIAEALIGPGSSLIGQSLQTARVRRRYGVYTMGLNRHGEAAVTRIEDEPLVIGDTLLLEGAPEDLARLAEDMGLIVINDRQAQPMRRTRAPIAALSVLLVVVGGALGIMPIAALAWIAVAIVLVTRCIDSEEAFAAIDWRIIIMIFSMLVVGRSLENTGAVDLIAAEVSPVLAGLPPIAVLAIIYVVASTLTEVVTNNAVSVVITPVAIGIAQSLGLDPRPFVLTVMFAASASFATPIGYQTNTLVYSAGGYRFMDFVKVGVPLNTLCGVVTVVGIWWLYGL